MSTTEHDATRDTGQDAAADHEPETTPTHDAGGDPAPSSEPGGDRAGAATPSEIERELRLARATELARAGLRDAADRLLADVPDPTPSELDLRARIRAQRGELAEADRLWARAAELSGEPDAYRAERAKITALQGRRIGTARTWRGLGRALLALVLVALVVTAVVWGLRSSAAGDRDVAELRAQQDRILAQLDRNAARPQPVPVSALPPDAGSRLAAPGLDVIRAGDRITVRLQQAAFTPNSADLDPQARDQLAGLGRRLAALGPDVQVRVIGHTTPTGDAAQVDGGDIGLLRADAAATALSSGGGPGRDRLVVLSAGSVDPPFPGGTGDGATARNRTVTVEVEPAG